ncbi:MAG TPA: hypothetical protein VFH55_01705, partial [Nitrospiria bacterium]|nr:hypothetical protein [Nitrospiria bacterium]
MGINRKWIKFQAPLAFLSGLMVFMMLGVTQSVQALPPSLDPPVVSSPPAIWEASLGSTILSGGHLDNDDNNTADITFGTFSFPFGGTTYTGSDILSISSNGFVSLGGDNGADCCNGSPTLLVNDAFARIAPFWTDLDPSHGGDVFINTFSDGGGPVDRIVITWAVGLHACSGPACHVLVQLQLLSDGTIIMGYNGIVLTSSVNTDVLIGVSPGGGVADPGSTDLSASIPFGSGSQSTVYERFINANPPPVDVDSTNIIFIPNGSGGFSVSNTMTHPPASTQPPTWESAIGHTISTVGLDSADDQTVDLIFNSFSFPFAGTTYTGGSTLSISSNGVVSLGGDNGASYVANPASFVNNPYAQIAPFWTDLYLDYGGDVFVNAFDDNGDTITDRIVITWEGGFYACNNGPTCYVAAQVQLLSNGTIIMGYNGFVITSDVINYGARQVLIGVTPAHGVPDPGSTDFDTQRSFDTGTTPTVYEEFLDPSGFDLDFTNITFTPNGSGGFTVDYTGPLPPVENNPGNNQEGLTKATTREN